VKRELEIKKQRMKDNQKNTDYRERKVKREQWIEKER